MKDDVQFQNQKTLKATSLLKNNVRFNRADMYDVLHNLDDNSNTVLMCRNVLGYFENDKIEKFVKIVSNKLKPESLFVVGDHDTKNSFIDRFLKENGFEKVM
ncbi:MAG: CheR family methyltransferase, partial [Candidatus Gastranaerophilaceae bacterium]